MENQELQKIKQEIEDLKRQHQQIDFRIQKLENEVYRDVSSIKIEQADEKNINSKHTQKLNKTVSKNNARNKDENKEDKDLEFRIGGTWLNRIGIVAVIFGLAYFLKYSFENHWIGETGRVLLGVLLGIIMLGMGEKLRTRYFGYAQGLIGGGSLAIFFSVYSSYQFYHLISPTLAFIFLIVVMANTVFMAIRHNSIAIGILGIIGGYATPFMIGSENPSLWTLFSYLILLTIGVLIVSMYKKWSAFQYLSFIFNQLIYAFTYVMTRWDYTDKTEGFAPLFSFLIVLFLLYFGVATIYNLRERKQATQLDVGLIALNAFTFFGWSYLLLEGTWVGSYLGFYALLLSLVYVYVGKWSFQLAKQDKLQVYTLFIVSFVFLTIAIPIQLAGIYIGLAWLAEAIGLVYMAQKLDSISISNGGVIVLGLGTVSATSGLMEIWGQRPFIFNTATLQFLSASISIYIVTRLMRGIKGGNIQSIYQALLGILLIFVFLGISIENSHFFSLMNINYFISPEQLSLSGVWLIYAIFLFTIGLRKNSQYMRYAALALLAVIIIKAFLIDLANLVVIYKILLFIILGISLLGISYFYQKNKHLLKDLSVKVEGEDVDGKEN